MDKNKKLYSIHFTFALVIILSLLIMGLVLPGFIKDANGDWFFGGNDRSPGSYISQQDSAKEVDELSHSYPSGTILFGSRLTDPSPHNEYYLMNADGVPLADIGTFTGFSAWSPDGKKLAIGCENIDQICILDMTNIVVYRSFPININKKLGASIIQKIDLPEQCKRIDMSDRGISSLSWSRNGERLIVVCKNHPPDSLITAVCSLTLSGKSNCWSEEESFGVSKAVFSPTEDILAISRRGDIEIVREDGSSVKTLVTGVNPAWSPDGKQLAYFSYYGGGPRNGIGLINVDSGYQSWLYKQPQKGSFEEYLCGLCDGNDDGGISWSPDGDYITFSANYLGDYTVAIFRENVKTKEITILVGLHGFFNYPQDPNWGKLDFE